MERALYDELYHTEENHWWFRGRRSVIRSVLKKIPRSQSQTALDIGCGTGLNTEMLNTLGFSAEGLESSDDAIYFARLRSPNTTVRKGSFPGVDREEKKYNLITLFDVLEHIEDDAGALRVAQSLLQPGGYVLLTVPAFTFLWTEHDALAHHRRRYRKKDLLEKLRAAGLHVTYVSYFNFFLFFPIALVRVIKKTFRVSSGKSDFALTPSWLNRVLTRIFALEGIFLRMTSFPVGVSIIVLARKDDAH